MADDFDTGFELLPEDEGEISLDEELADLLAAPAVVADPDETVEDVPVPLGRGWSFNFEINQFRLHGISPASVREVENLKMWIEKTLRTERFAHPIYSEQYGITWPDALIGQPFTPELAGKVGSCVEDALLVHDRITQVKDMAFTGGVTSDLLEVSFTVVLDEEELAIEAIPLPTAVF